MSSPLVSIVIPCYNYAQYVAETIDSALAQTYSPLEIIVMDDGSTDNTKEVVARYKDRVRYIHQQNQGLSATRNNGFILTKGEFVIFLDADDKLDPQYVAKTVAFAGRYPQAGYIYTQQQYFEASDTVTTFPDFNLAELKRHNYIPACTLIRASSLRQATYDPRLPSWEDWDFYLSLAERGISGRLLDEPLMLYRKHHDQKSMLDTFGERTKVRTLAHIRYKHWRLYGPLETLRFSLWAWSRR